MRPDQEQLDAPLAAALCEAISVGTGSPANIDSLTEITGGSISRALMLASAGERYFVKLNDAKLADMFAAEADGLRALAACPALRVPRVVGYGVSGRQAYLLLEYLPLQALRTGQQGAKAGHALAALHRQRGPQYGWHRDNFIGSTVQHNAEHRTWPFFFAHRRLLPQLELARRHAQYNRLIADGERLAGKLAALFVDHHPQPSLLHGDLWHGNAATDQTGTLTLFDPAVHFGDREADLAMSELFGGFPDSFYAGYREAWPLSDGYEQRKTLYNLYHVLNHLNLFGSGYLRQAERMVGTLLAELGC
ncbi:MAG: fructosamine kinase family protein [Candidatus Accumulibacter sp.]|nr:fructosamine kinase family protein [Accumulibacter sp.]